MGTQQLFGVMGDANMRYIASYIDAGQGRYVGSAHEAGAVSMADGYSRLSGRPGVATVTHGPGITNGLTALTEAVRAGSQLLVLTGETPRQAHHNQSLDLAAAAGLAGATYRQVRTPATAVDDIALAVRLCATGRQPVLLNIPVDLMAADIGELSTPFGFGPWKDEAVAPDADKLDAALGVIAHASRPLILAGRGVVLAEAREQVITLSKVLHAPTATTVMAMNYLAGHDLDLGIFGAEAHSLAIRYISQADCVIVLGAGLNSHTTASGDLLRDKAVVQCDSRPHAAGSRYPATVSLQGDAGVFASQVTEAIRDAGARPATAWAGRLREELRTFDPAAEFTDESSADGLDARTAMIALNEVLPEPPVLVTDIGRFKVAPWRFLRCHPAGFTQSGAFSAIGLGLPTAIGAAFANPGRLTVAAVGDGGLMMSLQELATAVEHELPLLIVVANDGSYGAEYQKLQEYGHLVEHSLRRWPSFAAVARAFGADGHVIRDVADIRQLGPDLGRITRPMLLDIRVNPAINTRKFR
jgi:thiamine pyrophosphate-dependent acetolactate synthase large subunit-like protein